MKKIFTLVSGAVLLSGVASSQSQRLVFVEEFTQASCAPCAAANPTFNATLNANATKVVALKHQVWWPGYDPMYNQNPGDVNTRVAYYAVTGVPDAVMDGNVQHASPNTAVTTAKINTEYAVASPFDMVLTHSFSPDYSTINITCTITASQAVSGTLMARVAIMERDIYFTAAPGSNGETHFEGVMKKMLPDANGTALPTTWAVGDVQTLTFSVPVPWYTYDLNQVAVVAYVQDDANKNVKQAAYSAPIGGLSTTDDAGISAITGSGFVNCTGTVTPSVTVKNYSTTGTLTACNISYSINNGPLVTVPWTGSLAPNATAVVALAPITLPNGLNNLSFSTSSPNGNVDAKPFNNFKFTSMDVITSSVPAPVVEDFQSATFPATDWAINNPNTDDTWEKINGYGGFALGSTESSIYLNFFNITAGKFDELYLPGVSFVNNTSAQLTFDVAYRQYQAENDKLEVMVSTDCGATWSTVYNKQGATLSTAAASTTNFAPTAAQWRAETVSLSSYVGQNIIMKFKGTSNYGNNLWIDNINVSGTTGINQIVNNNSVKVYPSVVSDKVTISTSFTENQNLTIVVTDVLGQQLSSLVKQNVKTTDISLDMSSYAKGSYFVTLTSGNETFTSKVVKD